MRQRPPRKPMSFQWKGGHSAARFMRSKPPGRLGPPRVGPPGTLAGPAEARRSRPGAAKGQAARWRNDASLDRPPRARNVAPIDPAENRPRNRVGIKTKSGGADGTRTREARQPVTGTDTLVKIAA